MFFVLHDTLCLSWKVSPVVLLWNVLVSTKWLVQMVHLPVPCPRPPTGSFESAESGPMLKHCTDPGFSSSGVGRTEGIRLFLSVRPILCPTIGGLGSTAFICLSFSRMSWCRLCSQVLSGGLPGWCVITKGTLLPCFSCLYWRLWERGMHLAFSLALEMFFCLCPLFLSWVSSSSQRCSKISSSEHSRRRRMNNPNGRFWIVC